MANKKTNIKAIIIIACSGAGKGTVINALLALAEINKNFNLKKSISDTTRPQKNGELDGVDYNFISLDEFMDRKAKGHYIETDEYAGNWYGSPKDQLIANSKGGIITVYDVEPNGAEALQNFIIKHYCLTFRLDVPAEELAKRVAKRDRDTNSEQQARRKADQKRTEKMLRIAIAIPYGPNALADGAANQIYNELFEK